jgi:hypothetical protein
VQLRCVEVSVLRARIEESANQIAELPRKIRLR